MAEFDVTIEGQGVFRVGGLPDDATEIDAYRAALKQIESERAESEKALGEALTERDPVSRPKESPILRAGLSGLAELPLGLAEMLTPETFFSKPVPEGAITDPIRESLGLIERGETESLGEAFAFGAGEVLPIAIGGGATLAAKAPQLATRAAEATTKVGRFFPKLGQKIGETFARSPAPFLGIETLGGGGAEVARKLAEEAGGGPLAQAGASVAGGITTATLPNIAINILRRTGTAITEALLAPFKAGGQMRAARALEGRAAAPLDELARRIDDAPPEVTPARATEDPGALATEAKILEGDPILAREVEDQLLAGRTRVSKELDTAFGPGHDPGDFQHAVVQSVAAPGTAIPKGATDDMIRLASESYEGAYQAAKGHPIRIPGGAPVGPETSGLGELVGQSAFRSDILATPAEREGMFTLLSDLADNVAKGAAKRRSVTRPRGTVLSDELLEMRSRIRKRLRVKARAGATGDRAEAEAAILRAANEELTSLLNDQLPQAAKRALQQTDESYRQFITVQNAAFRGNGEFTVAQLQTSLRVRTPEGVIARGEAGELAALAQRGTDLRKVLGKPRDAARVVRDMNPEQLAATKGDFAKIMIKKATITLPDDTVGISGKSLTSFLKEQRKTMEALGFSADDFARADNIAKQLRIMERKSPAAVANLLEDGPGRILNALSAIVGSLTATRGVKKIFGSAGAGPSLIIARLGSENLRATVRSLTLDQAATMLRDSVTNRELYKAILVTSTDPILKQVQAGRQIQAYLAGAGIQALEEE